MVPMRSLLSSVVNSEQEENETQHFDNNLPTRDSKRIIVIDIDIDKDEEERHDGRIDSHQLLRIFDVLILSKTFCCRRFSFMASPLRNTQTMMLRVKEFGKQPQGICAGGINDGL